VKYFVEFPPLLFYPSCRYNILLRTPAVLPNTASDLGVYKTVAFWGMAK
jgi:hypothetical protein